MLILILTKKNCCFNILNISKENKINTKLTVAGKIKYAVNAKKVDSNTVKVTSVKEPVVVIYK